jgi:aryl-alcohol dehydrogenase (NADP+)
VNQQLDASLANLQTDRIDLYYAHKDHERQPLGDVVRLFHELVESGRVRHIGLSNFSAERASEWVKIAQAEGLHRPVAIQPHYNLMVRRDYETGLSPVAKDLGLGVTPYAGLARGFLSGRYSGTETEDSGARAKQALGYATPEGLAVLEVVKELAAVQGVSAATIALAWLLARPEILAPIASSSSLEQLPDLVAATSLELGADELARLNNTDNGES